MIWIPKVESDGLRRYGRWAGNPQGMKEDVTRCAWIVCEARWIPRQCARKRGHGPDGLLCRQHARMATEG
jgi:hypothetical protein